MARRQAKNPEEGRTSEVEHIAENPEGISSDITDDIPNDTGPRPNPGETLNPRETGQNRNTNSRATTTRSSQTRTQRPARDRQHGETVGWVDDDYYESNPWYGQTNKKPVFGLGKPLPHTNRWNKRPKAAIKSSTRAPEDIAELGEMKSAETAFPKVSRKGSTMNGEHTGARRTAAGVTHGAKYNDAGQPVFNYQPGSDDDYSRQDRADTGRTGRASKSEAEDRPTYGIDSEPIGQREHDEVEQGDRDPNEFRNRWARFRAKHPEPLAEFLATGVAVFLGLAATLSVNLSANQPVKYGTYETSCWAWGFAWMFGIYLGGGVSGAHMNPAISISLSLFRGFPWRRCLIYVVVQFIASIAAGALAYGIYRDTIRHVDPTMTETAKTFFSSPQEWVSPGTAFFDQLVGSAIMAIVVFALGDDQNNPPGAGMHAFVLGLLVTTLKFTLGYNIGSALNPASDFGPRVVAWAVGYRGPEVFGNGWWFYGPWLSTLAGSIIGCSIYDGFIFVGSESPVNYRGPGSIKRRTRKMLGFEESE
ncbi:aquaporin-like protein [Xylariaceae sp. FL0662B]|nr:aquaporin-like protein [Xylariaceae sp. FL0662B]